MPFRIVQKSTCRVVLRKITIVFEVLPPVLVKAAPVLSLADWPILYLCPMTHDGGHSDDPLITYHTENAVDTPLCQHLLYLVKFQVYLIFDRTIKQSK